MIQICKSIGLKRSGAALPPISFVTPGASQGPSVAIRGMSLRSSIPPTPGDGKQTFGKM